MFFKKTILFLDSLEKLALWISLKLGPWELPGTVFFQAAPSAFPHFVPLCSMDLEGLHSTVEWESLM